MILAPKKRCTGESYAYHASATTICGVPAIVSNYCQATVGSSADESDARESDVDDKAPLVVGCQCGSYSDSASASTFRLEETAMNLLVWGSTEVQRSVIDQLCPDHSEKRTNEPKLPFPLCSILKNIPRQWKTCRDIIFLHHKYQLRRCPII